MPVHDRFDLQYWSAQFQLGPLRTQAREFVLKRRDELPGEYPGEAAVDDHITLMEPGGQILVGPGSLAVNEQLRAEAFAGRHYRGERIATDVFVWAAGEPPNPAMTKIGGVPYRSRSSIWPQDEDGKPLRFIGQICFADSRDLVGNLPGDLLLLFGDDEALFGEPERLVFEWSNLGIRDPTFDVPLITAGGLLGPFYAVIHRTEDWPEAQFEERYKSPWHLCVFEGTKIAGLPSFIQDTPTQPGRFLAALGSICGTYSDYPLMNESKPRDLYNRELMIGDMGSLYFFLDRGGRVRVESQCY